MATLTPSGLVKPDYTDDASVFPINDNSKRIDSYGLGAHVISGDIFPTDPWEGMKVYKEDFHELYIFSTMNGNVTPGQWWLLGAGRKINYTPVITGVTLGTGGISEGQYFRVGHNGLLNATAIYWRAHIGLGTGGDITTTIQVGLPGVPEMWAAAGADLMMPVGLASAAQSAAPAASAVNSGIVICGPSTAVGTDGETQQMLQITPDSNVGGSLWNDTIPFDWTASSHIWLQGWYWPNENGLGWGV